MPIGDISAAVDINVGGWVVGYTFGPMPGTGFVWKDVQSGSFPVGLPESSDGNKLANGINNRNQNVGFAHDQDGRQQAVLWETGSAPKALGTLGGRSSAATAINDSGQVVGEAGTINNSGNRAFLWQEEIGMQDLGALAEGRSSETSGINDWGAVVGTATNSNGQENARSQQQD